MSTLGRGIAVVIAAAGLALSGAAVAGATPKCSDVGKTVTYCETNGSTQLTSTPPPFRWGGWQGGGYYPFGGFGYFP
ncbi:hypothetical protein Mycch_4297 [Mycolicibacterium chubuense NBB4]|uniref:Uncharacterized protein n=1 Tax=Mycolicibacterium chubuense (strain NBB4) TaxID=710421 RepID=I4BP03_MYCCN|nr:hypothetical protein [Mycolicibacterium chubuense]AFM19010.1 hypothetical protein Mycch_4297 [Mycolicibacterium chubuense NBB4]